MTPPDVQTWLLLHKVTLTLLAEFDFGPSVENALQELIEAIPPPPTPVMKEPLVRAAQELLDQVEPP